MSTKIILHVVLSLISMTGIAQQLATQIEQKFEKEQPFVDFKEGSLDITIDPVAQSIAGTVVYTLKIHSPTTSITVDAQNMQILQVQLDEIKAMYTYDDKKVKITADFKINSEHAIRISYKATPKKALYFVKDYQGNDQIWTQGQGKYSSNWVPSFDDMNEKVTYDLTINYDKEYEVIANGKLLKKEAVNDTIQRWYYDMQNPMSSYLLAFVIGTYDKTTETSESGIPLEMYYYPADTNKVAYTYAHNKQLFDLMEKEIGYPFPWQNYKQIPVKDFLYAGMENTGTTIFSDAFVTDSIAYNDRNYVSVNAHELAHQWFGNLVTASHGTHHWLQEGFATYYALLAEKEIFGEAYFYYKLYESAEQLTEQSKAKEATSLLDPKASSLTFYQRGAWALHALKQLIGESSFRITIHNYLHTYAHDNVSTDDFMTIAEEVSGKDLSAYTAIWLEAVQFPSQEALDILTTTPFIKTYLGLAQERTQPLAGKWGVLAKALEEPLNDYIGQEVVYQLEGDTSQEAIALLDQAFHARNMYVRQTIANTMSEIPSELKKQYESLLEDSSYATIEPALYHLWSNFPSDRAVYLDKTKNIIGFHDKNVRILWLVLALSTKGYETAKHQEFYNELSGYTSGAYHFSTRKNAFTYLESLQSYSEDSLVYLVDGAVHHYWRFRKFCRQLLDNVLTDVTYQKKYRDLMHRLPISQQKFLEKKLTP